MNESLNLRDVTQRRVPFVVVGARAPRPPTSTVSVSYYIQHLFATAKAMLVFVFTPRFFCENDDDDDDIIKIALFVQSFPCIITRQHWLCCCCGSHFHRFLSPREEHLVQNGIVCFRSSPSLFLVESRDFRLSLFCRFAFRVSQFHLAISQAFVSFRRFQPRKLFRFSSRFRIIIERPLDVFLERFLSQLGDASRAKLRLAPLVVDEPGEHGLRKLREVLLEFLSVAIHLWVYQQRVLCVPF